MAAKNVGRPARFGLVKPYTRRAKLGLVQVHRAVHALLQARGYRLFQFSRLGFVVLQARQPRFPLG